MKQIIIALLITHQMYALRMLHISCHNGCIQEFTRVAQECDITLTSWHVLHPDVFARLSDAPKPTYTIMNMTHEKAARIWQRNQQFFESFDAIITSDTAPFSRIFLQNGWKKPLIIWVCNRFDYHHESAREQFPDAAYYELMREAPLKSNVFVVSYTPYEHRYARNKGVELGKNVIKPIGAPREPVHKSAFGTIDKSRYIFISQTGPAPLHKEQKATIDYLRKQCAQRGISTCSGWYNGPDDLAGIKGVLHFPYQASNLFLFENIQRGIIHFVPSETFLAMARTSNEPHMPCKQPKYWLDSFQESEWYQPENKKFFVYFDSFDDLKTKIDTLDFDAKRAEIMQHAAAHRSTMLKKWRSLFNQITSLISSKEPV